MVRFYTLMLTIMIVIIFSELGRVSTHDSKFNDNEKLKLVSTDAPIFTIPVRSINISGTDFGNSIMDMGPNQTREDLIFAQYLAGNIPEFMRNPISVKVTEGNNTLIYWVLPDVLCVGTNADYLRTSLNPLTAKKIANIFSGVLPTRKMAYQIWQTSTVKLTPSPNGPPYDATMMSTERMVFHNKKIQIALGDKIPGELVNGHKKDIVVSVGLFTHPNNVAIVGWWYPSGEMIQPLNYVSHDHYYKDYSHGIRIINRMVTVNGALYDIFDVLRNEALAPLISDEGSFDATQMYT